MRLALVIDLQVNADCVRAFLILADIFEIELLALARLLFRRAVGIGDERFAPLHLRQRFEKIDDLFQLLGIHGPSLTYHAFGFAHQGVYG